MLDPESELTDEQLKEKRDIEKGIWEGSKIMPTSFIHDDMQTFIFNGLLNNASADDDMIAD